MSIRQSWSVLFRFLMTQCLICHSVYATNQKITLEPLERFLASGTINNELLAIKAIDPKFQLDAYLAFFKAKKVNVHDPFVARMKVSGNVFRVEGINGNFSVESTGKVSFNGRNIPLKLYNSPEANYRLFEAAVSSQHAGHWLAWLIPWAQAQEFNVNHTENSWAFTAAVAVTAAGIFTGMWRQSDAVAGTFAVAGFSLLIYYFCQNRHVSVDCLTYRCGEGVSCNGENVDQDLKEYMAGNPDSPLTKKLGTPGEAFQTALRQGCQKSVEKTEKFFKSYIMEIKKFDPNKVDPITTAKRSDEKSDYNEPPTSK